MTKTINWQTTDDDKSFDTSHLTGRAAAMADAVVSALTDYFNHTPYGGGCKAFYSPEEWTVRRETYGCNAQLVITHDGGDLSTYNNNAAEVYGVVNKALKPFGAYVEHCTGWYSAVYPLHQSKEIL